MFTKGNEKSDRNPDEVNTFIGHSMIIEGNFKGDGDVVIDGQVKGTISIQKTLFVGEKSTITADIEARNAVIAGTVFGNITVLEKIEINATAKIKGNINAKNIQVVSGAELNGKINMNSESGSNSLSNGQESIHSPNKDANPEN